MTKQKAKAKAKSKTTRGQKGGKPGNQNARKHGLYAKNQPKVTASGEGNIEVGQIEHRRHIADEVIERLFTKFNTLDDIDQLCKCANSISLAITAANGCDRTLAITSGKLTNLSAAIEALLMEEDADDPNTIE